MTEQPAALRLADEIEECVSEGRYSVGGPADCAAAELRRLSAWNARLTILAKQREELLEALKVAEQFMGIASDWNIDEAEINGQMRSTYDWLDVVRAAIAKAEGQK